MKKLEKSDLLKFSGGNLNERGDQRGLNINKECYKLGLATVLLWPLSAWVPYTREWRTCMNN